MTASKKTEIHKTVTDHNIDCFIITESNISKGNEIFYNMNNYNINHLYKNRQIASGIMVGTRDNITAKFHILKQRNQNNTSEMVKIDIWKGNHKFNVYGIYIPPGNKQLNLNIIETDNNKTVTGDFNGHSPR
jgi:hypothetical protein